ncbi:MAG: thioredoxin-dependent thiol peroxidase [Crocinitomicaceae bacterium]
MEKLALGSLLPNLTGKNQRGEDINLSTYLGKKTVVYFYPKDDTPGCTAQACSIRDGMDELTKNGIEVIGISADSVSAHAKFVSKYNLSFSLISDESKEFINAFGVWGTKKFMGKVYDGIHRTTFLFDEVGALIHVIDKPDTKNHAQEIMKKYQII